MATVYKSTSYKTVNNRAVAQAESSKVSAISSTISTFFTHFKAKHLQKKELNVIVKRGM